LTPAIYDFWINDAGKVGIGTTNPTSKLEIAAQDGLGITGFQPFLTLRDSNAGNSRSVIQGVNGHIVFYPNSFIGGTPPMTIFSGTGSVGIGTSTPAHRLSIAGGPSWTSNLWKGAVALENASALGWKADPGGQRFGIGQSTGGLYFFHTTSEPGTIGSPSNYDLQISDTGKLRVLGNAEQTRDKGGLAKAMVVVNADGTIARCFNSFLAGGESTAPCGFHVTAVPSATNIDFGFQVRDRFYAITPFYNGTPGDSDLGHFVTFGVNFPVSANALRINYALGGDYPATGFSVVIY
jgi:hypothetical protein